MNFKHNQEALDINDDRYGHPRTPAATQAMLESVEPVPSLEQFKAEAAKGSLNNSLKAAARALERARASAEAAAGTDKDDKVASVLQSLTDGVAGATRKVLSGDNMSAIQKTANIQMGPKMHATQQTAKSIAAAAATAARYATNKTNASTANNNRGAADPLRRSEVMRTVASVANGARFTAHVNNA